MPRTAETKKIKEKSELKPEKKGSGFFDYLRFGESYTSLILGIIVVIIATALLLSFVHNKSVGNRNVPIDQQTQNTVDVTQKTQQLSAKTPSSIVDNPVSVGPTETVAPTIAPTSTPVPTAEPKPTSKPKIAKPTPTKSVVPTAKPTVVSMIKPKIVAKKVIKTSPKSVSNLKNKNIWVVQKGESLWVIAQEKYSSGYNWVDIARANNLSNPGDIHVGDRLVLPNVTPKATTVTVAVSQPTPTTAVQQKVSTTMAVNMTKITGNSYTVQRGDNMWNIAVRAYGDGFRWTDIAKANGLTDPRMIFSGNTLQIPRP